MEIIKMSKYVTFKLVNSDDERIYLKGEVDINTIDDTDGGNWEYEQNNGLMENHIPQYWKVGRENLSFEFNQFINSIDWDMFRQYLWDCQDDDITVNFYGNILIINDGSAKSTTIRVKESTKIKLNNIGKRNETFDEIINRLIEEHNSN